MAVRGSGAGVPESSPACGFGGDPGDLAQVVRERHRAEAREWLALFRAFGQEESRLSRERAGALAPGLERLRADAAAATCARWCVAAPVTAATMRYRLRAAVQLFEHLPLLAEAFLEGVVSAQVVKQIVERTYEVDPQVLPALDAAVRGEVVEPIAAGVRFAAKALDAAVDALVALMDPDGVRTVRRTARAGVGVGLAALRGGVAQVQAVMPGAAGAAVFATVDALARRLHGRRPRDEHGKRLPLGQCRAVALLVLTAGRGAVAAAELTEQALVVLAEELDAVAGAVPDRAQVTVTVHTGAEAAARPADGLMVWIARLGLLPASAAAGLLARARREPPRPGPADQLRPADPLSWLGAPLTPPDPRASAEHALAERDDPDRVAELNRAERRALARLARDRVPGYALRYRIPDWLRVRVRQRDGCCRFPGCGVPAADCDVDHLEPFLHRDPISGGWTVELNLGCLCRRHHRVKTRDRWTITTDLQGVFTFTAPDGATAVTYPAGPAEAVGTAEQIFGPPEPRPPDPGDPECRIDTLTDTELAAEMARERLLADVYDDTAHEHVWTDHERAA